MIALLAACVGGISLTDAQKAEVQRLGEAARTFNEPLEQARKQAILDARAIGPRPDLGPCPVGIRRPHPGDVGSFADSGVTFALSTTVVSVVPAEDLARSDGPRWDRVQNAIVNDVDAMLIGTYWAADYAEVDRKLLAAARLDDLDYIPVDATFVIDAYRAPEITGKTFIGGAVVGRFYVWDYAKGAIVCASTARAENSDTLGVHMHLDDSNTIVGAKSDADRDLYRNAVNLAIDGLAAAGPALIRVF